MEIPFFKIRNSSFNDQTAKIEIAQNVKERLDKGVYDHFDLAKVWHHELTDAKSHEGKLSLALKAISYSWAIDINEFEIRKKKGPMGGLIFLFQTVIWKLLKFYTYRLFFQQREFNSQIANACLYFQEQADQRILELENKITQLKG